MADSVFHVGGIEGKVASNTQAIANINSKTSHLYVVDNTVSTLADLVTLIKTYDNGDNIQANVDSSVLNALSNSTTTYDGFVTVLKVSANNCYYHVFNNQVMAYGNLQLSTGNVNIINDLKSDITNINTALTGKVNTSDIANNLTTTASGKVLDARQGKTLNTSLSGKIPYPSSYATTWLAASTSATTKYTTTSAGWFYITCNANDGDHGFQIGGVKITKIGSYIFPCKSGVEITLIGNGSYATTLYKVS